MQSISRVFFLPLQNQVLYYRKRYSCSLSSSSSILRPAPSHSLLVRALTPTLLARRLLFRPPSFRDGRRLHPYPCRKTLTAAPSRFTLATQGRHYVHPRSHRRPSSFCPCRPPHRVLGRACTSFAIIARSARHPRRVLPCTQAHRSRRHHGQGHSNYPHPSRDCQGRDARDNDNGWCHVENLAERHFDYASAGGEYAHLETDTNHAYATFQLHADADRQYDHADADPGDGDRDSDDVAGEPNDFVGEPDNADSGPSHTGAVER
jgi:hypothetical protein